MHRDELANFEAEHLLGSEDTEYKRKVANYFEQVGHAVTWQQLGEDFKDHKFRFQVVDESAGGDWRDRLSSLLDDPSVPAGAVQH